MTKREYAQEIANAVNGKVMEVAKANGIIHTGINVPSQKSKVSPTVYIDEYYEQSREIEEAVEMVKTMIEKNRVDDFDVTQITDFSKVKENLRARLYSDRTQAEVFRTTDCMDGLIVVPYIRLKNDEFGGYASVKVTRQILQNWDVSEDEVFRIAYENSAKDVKFVNMAYMMAEMMGLPVEVAEAMAGDNEMYVLSNSDKMFGAIGALVAREMLKERFPDGYVILPSSVHEVIVLPYTAGMDTDCLNEMVKEVNMQEVLPEEVLGDRAYVFAA